MPHSSGGGGGSFHSGGSFRSSSSHSGGSVDPTPIIHRTYKPGMKHRYVRYYHHHPLYYYSDRSIKSESIFDGWLALLGIGAAIALFTGAIMMIVSYRSEPDPLDLHQYNSQIEIVDTIDAIENEDALYDSLESFQQLTGITPSVITLNSDQYRISDEDDLEDVAYDLYVDRYDDECHWLITYSANHKNWYWLGMQGDDTDDIVDDYLKDDFNDIIQNELEKGQAVDTAIKDAFDHASIHAFDHGIVHPILNKVGAVFVAIGVMCVVGFGMVFKKSKNTVLYEVNELQSDPVTTFCPSCNGEYVSDLHSVCPYCGNSGYLEDRVQKY